MNNNLYGKLEYNNEKYPFYLEDRIVRIIGEPFQYNNDFKNADEIEIIRGITSGNKDIIFLRCKFIKKSFKFIEFSIEGYAISKSDMGVPCDFTYTSSSFESDAIDTFFSPQKAVNFDEGINDETGEISIKISPFKATSIGFDYLDSKCQFSISRYVRIHRDPTSIGQVKSVFTFEHSQVQSITKVIDDYCAIYDFLSFVNYSTNIPFKKIIIGKKNDDGCFENTAIVHFFIDKSEYENTDFNTITIDDIPQEKLCDIFSCIASLRNKDKRLRFYFPENNQERRYIDPGKWLIAALNFEGLFTETYPGFKCNMTPSFNNAKQLALERIDNTSDGKSLSKNEQKHYQNCRRQIERYEGQLEEKFNYVLKNNKDVVAQILQYNEKHLSTKLSENYGKIFADYRNKIAHGSVEPIADKQVAAYRLLRPFIYLLILSKIDLTPNEKKKVIAKLFE